MPPRRIGLVLIVWLGAAAAHAAVPPELAARILAAEDRRDERPRFLTALLADPDPDVRERAALALGRIGAPRASGPLVARLRAEPEPRVRETLCLALGLVARPEGTKALVQALAKDP